MPTEGRPPSFARHTTLDHADLSDDGTGVILHGRAAVLGEKLDGFVVERASFEKTFDDERRYSAIVPVRDLHAHAELACDRRRCVEPFCAALGGDVWERRAHEVGVETPGPRYVCRIVDHGAANAFHRL